MYMIGGQPIILDISLFIKYVFFVFYIKEKNKHVSVSVCSEQLMQEYKANVNCQ